MAFKIVHLKCALQSSKLAEKKVSLECNDLETCHKSDLPL